MIWNMKSSSNEIAEKQMLLGKEFLGVLSFELNLPALFTLLNCREMGIGLNRLADWVLFPHKIPEDSRCKIEEILGNRHNHPDYNKLHFYEMDENERNIHSLITELLRLKYSGKDVNHAHFNRLYEIPDNMFFAILTQMIEKQHINSLTFMRLYTYRSEKRGELDEQG